MKKNNLNRMNRWLSALLSLTLVSCEGVLDPLPSGHITDENISEFPSYLKGFVDRAYSLATTTTYNTTEYIFLDCATEDGVLTSPTTTLRRFAEGSINPSEDPFYSYWTRDYQGIYYCNRFLKDDMGLNTKYMVSTLADSLLRNNYQGDAYALRAWFGYDLLRKFGGVAEDGKLLGVPIVNKCFEQSEVPADSWERASFDDCVRQILSDCDAALPYLPVANRNWYALSTQVQGACRWQKFDRQSVTALKALVYLLWASDTYNPGGDVTRWENAAKYAYDAMRFKLDDDGAHGFNPMDSYNFLDPNNKDALWISLNSGNTATMEAHQYPNGFLGSAVYTPSQNLVDAFPMANGYPIDDSRSGYDPQNPYAGRDPRFYSTIFYHGSSACRNGNASDVMYTFDMCGKDISGQILNGLTGYYLKKHLYMGWNGNDQNVQYMPRSVVYIGWRDMVLAFAEAANRAWGPTDSRLGMSAKQALSYIRNRKTFDGAQGLGTSGDPYLEECASSKDRFEALVRNERRIEFCFEGKRFYDMVRWGIPLSERNVPVYRADITASGDGTFSYGKSAVYTLNLKSRFLPIPFIDMQRASGLVQNEGWSSWSGK